jgi:hypothetical protein
MSPIFHAISVLILSHCNLLDCPHPSQPAQVSTVQRLRNPSSLLPSDSPAQPAIFQRNSCVHFNPALCFASRLHFTRDFSVLISHCCTLLCFSAPPYAPHTAAFQSVPNPFSPSRPRFATRFSVLIFHALHFTLFFNTTLRRSAAQSPAHFPMLIGDALFADRPLLTALFRYQFDLFIACAPSPGVMGGQFRVLLTPIP